VTAPSIALNEDLSFVALIKRKTDKIVQSPNPKALPKTGCLVLVINEKMPFRNI
jgi:hypothetical protein